MPPPLFRPFSRSASGERRLHACKILPRAEQDVLVRTRAVLYCVCSTCVLGPIHTCKAAAEKASRSHRARVTRGGPPGIASPAVTQQCTMLRHSALSLARAVRPVRAYQRLPTAAAAEEAAAVRHDIRNVAIVAHVDHGKTTLVDALLQHTKAVVDTAIGKDDRLMDGNDQERERGITILAKNTAVTWKDTKINIVDTLGTPTLAERWSGC